MRAVVVAHSHWDREWYRTFQVFRHRLIGLMEAVFPLLEEPGGLAGFLLDGQVSILDDVFEVRPDWEPRIRRLVEAGRLWIGPWYTLPDEFLVSGEALVRNLSLGIRKAKRLGGWMAVGYTPDSFGHQAQLPQLLRGFGIDSAIFQRGLGDEPALLEWDSPDRSRVLVCYLRDSYNNAAWLPDEPEAFARALRRVIDSLAAHTPVPAVLLMSGNDHLYPGPNLPLRLREAAARLPGVDLRSGSLEDYVAEARTAVAEAGVELHAVTGELRSGRRHPILSGVLSTRMWLKQRNAAAQTLLERYAEPLCALVPGAAGQRPFLEEAWRLLLLNQFHDSICGTGVDAVHREMDVRFDSVEAIGWSVVESAALAAGDGPAGPGEMVASDPSPGAALVFNPVPGEAAVVPARLRLRALPPGLTYRVTGADGAELPVRLAAVPELSGDTWEVPPQGWGELIDALESGRLRDRPVGRAWVEASGGRLWVEWGDRRPTELMRLAAVLRRLPAPGTAIRVRAQSAGAVELALAVEPPPGVGASSLRVQVTPGDAAALDERQLPEAVIENERFRLEADPADGTLRLADQLTGEVFTGLNRIRDGGDAGDVYNYSAPPEDRLVETPRRVQVRAFEQPPYGSCLEVALQYELPAGLTSDRRRRAGDLVATPVVVRAWLRAGVPRVDIETTLLNRARDHRLRVHFATPIRARSWHTGNAYALLERGLEPEPWRAGDAEAPSPTRPMDGFAFVERDRAGLLLSARGLPEVEAASRPDGSVSLALTLLRCVGWLSRDGLLVRPGHAGPQLETPSAQCPGDWRFHYSLIPYAGDRSAAIQEALRYLAPPVAIATAGPPASLRRVRLTPSQFVLTALKPADDGDGVILRGYNASAGAVPVEVDFGEGLEAAWVADLLERPTERLRVEDWRVRVEAGPWKVVTIRARFRPA